MTSRVPTASIGVPVYNGEKYLANALNALLQQDFEDFEIIVADNASTDATPEICRSFAARDSRIRYIRNERNLGLAANHNVAFRASRGKYYKWAAHDDECAPAMLSRFVQEMESASPSTSLVYSYCAYIDDEGNVIGGDVDGIACDAPQPHRRLSYLLRHVHMYGSAYGLIRAEILRRTRLHGLFPGSDRVLLAELAMLGPLIEVSEPLVRIRQHGGRTFTAHSSNNALYELFTPGKVGDRKKLSIERRIELELVRGALAIPLAPKDRILCLLTAMAKPQWENFRAFGGRQRRRLVALCSSGKTGVAAVGDRESNER